MAEYPGSLYTSFFALKLQQNICKLKKTTFKKFPLWKRTQGLVLCLQGRYFTIIAYMAKWMWLYYSELHLTTTYWVIHYFSPWIWFSIYKSQVILILVDVNYKAGGYIIIFKQIFYSTWYSWLHWSVYHNELETGVVFSCLQVCKILYLV